MARLPTVVWGDKLSPREIRFCEEYVKDFNGAQAALRTGKYKSYESASTSAHNMLKKPEVRAYIENLQMKVSEQCATDVNDLMEFWTTIMFDVNESTANRLKASDNLAKVLGAYNIKVETKQVPQIIMDLGLPPAPEPLAIQAAVEAVFEDEYDEDDVDDS